MMRNSIAILVLLVVFIPGCSIFDRHIPTEDYAETAPDLLLEHRVSYPGETPGLISLWYTGSDQHWQAIKKLNLEVDERRLQLGSSIFIPRYLLTTEQSLPEWFVQRDPQTVVAKGEDAYHEPLQTLLAPLGFFPEIDTKQDPELLKKRDELLQKLIE